MPSGQVGWEHGSSAGYTRRRCRCPLCVDWSRTYHRERVRRVKAEWFAGRVCAVCGTAQDLQLDHVDPSTKSPLLGRSGSNQDIWKWPVARRTAELLLCQALCGDHHKEKSAQEMVERHALGLHHKIDPALGRAAKANRLTPTPNQVE